MTEEKEIMEKLDERIIIGNDYFSKLEVGRDYILAKVGDLERKFLFAGRCMVPDEPHLPYEAIYLIGESKGEKIVYGIWRYSIEGEKIIAREYVEAEINSKAVCPEFKKIAENYRGELG